MDTAKNMRSRYLICDTGSQRDRNVYRCIDERQSDDHQLRKKLIDKYAAWEQELDEREAALKEREQTVEEP